MDNKILKAIENLDKKIENSDKKFENLDKKIENLDKKFENLDKKIGNLDKKFEKRFDVLEEDVSILKSQTWENTEMLKALIHASEVHKAEIDNISLKVAHIEGDVTAIKKDLSTVETVTASNYTDIVRLKAIR
jgi:chromosome segregation ATPase